MNIDALHDLLQQLPNASLDKALATANISHYRYRRWLVARDLKLPRLTQGLINEVVGDDLSPKALLRKYNLSTAELSKILYEDVHEVKEIKPIKQSMLDLDELTKDLIANRLSQVSMAAKYGITQGRVSQLKKQILGATQTKKQRPPLTDAEKDDIANSKLTVMETAIKYNVSINTVYRIKRACKNT